MNKVIKPLLIVTSMVASFSAQATCGSSGNSLALGLSSSSSSNCVASHSLDSTSPASVSSQIVSSKLTSKVLSHRQLRVIKQAGKSPTSAMVELKYEQGKLSPKNTGDIEGVTASLSTEFAGTEVGLYVPYEYLDFKTFDANRIGALAYAKRDWQLPNSLQLTTLAHINTIATYTSEPTIQFVPGSFSFDPATGIVTAIPPSNYLTTTHGSTTTLGAGFGTALTYDTGGDFVPKAMFAFQYSQDSVQGFKADFKDNHQYLVKFGGSLGYRLLDNATLNGGFTYNLDTTTYKDVHNQQKDNDYFDLTFGASYAVADMWQVTANYKRILGLTGYHSNAVFLGTTLGF